MLRPERMSRVSVTGAKHVMDDVIEVVHDLRLLHVTEYDGSWDGFDPGHSLEGADEASEKLVTVRSLQSILGVEEEDAGPTQLVTDDALDDELEDIRTDVNELDDRRDELRDELRSVEEQIDTMEPFVTLGIDLDLLGGYDSLSVLVGEGDPEAVEAALADSEIDTHEVFSEDGVAAVFARTDEDELRDAMVGVPFNELAVPEGDGDPGQYLEELRHRKQQLESELDTVEDELEDIKLDVAGFLLAAEEQLSIEAEKRDAPLTFATTDNAFVAEGWIPTEEFETFARELRTEVGDSVEIEELERADYDDHGHAESHEEVGGSGGESAGAGAAATADADAGDQRAAADGGVVTMGDDDPPVIQDNPSFSKPFETLVEIINRPKYSEFDPTVILFLTFPVFFGFMIGDLGYGILYAALGYWLTQSFDSDVIKSLGGIGMWAGAFTMLFGVLYGEIFGLHLITQYLWEGALGLHGPPIHKGLEPAEVSYAQTWLVVSVLVGLLHLTVGYVLDFIQTLRHGVVDAVTETGSWMLMMGGIWVFIFSKFAASMKPSFLVGSEAVFNGHPFALGFTGFSPTVGLVGLGLFAVGIVLLGIGDVIELVEFLQVLVNVLSYTRIAAVLLAKAGMAFVVNLLFFGAYTTEGEFHFMMAHGPQYVLEHNEQATVMFPGLIHSGIAGVVGGLVVLVLGHLLVLALGITSAGLQAVRLEYVEFFGKFYEGGGKPYNPFGRERRFTAED
ncbi:MAG: V-type ATP synthase subunit I [Haloarculaceae archaeon]